MSDKVKKQIKIVEVGEKDDYKVKLVAETNGEKWTCYVWNKSVDKDPDSYKVGATGEYDVENRPYQGNNQYFIWKPKGGGTRGGGVAKSDPAKNAIIQNGNHLNNATSCMEMAVTLLGPGHDINAVRTLAFDLAKCAKEIAGTF